jgi:hypothetical protein
MQTYKIDVFQETPISGLTSKFINNIADAAIVCLDNQRHNSGVVLKINGSLNGNIVLSWSDEVTNQIKDTWNDLEETTEYGATYIAIVVVYYFTSLKAIKRSVKGTGFDYWLGEKEDEISLFQEKARLEISGILQENKNGQVRYRVKEKIKQVEKSDSLRLPAYIVVVEFGTPKSEVAMK